MRGDVKPYIGPLEPLVPIRFSRIANVVAFAEVPSTNEFCKMIADRMLADDTDLPPSVFVTWNQTAGRGRAGRSWTSLEGSLALSVLLPWPQDQRRVRLPVSFGIGLARGLSEKFGIDIRLKWPNDLLVGTKKLAGILCEGRLNADGAGYSIVGLGINVTTSRETLEAAGLTQATSLSLVSSHLPANAGPALGQILAAVDEAIDSYPDDIPTAFSEVAAHPAGTMMTVHEAGRLMEGRYLGLTEDGFLRLETSEGEELVLSGDVMNF